MLLCDPQLFDCAKINTVAIYLQIKNMSIFRQYIAPLIAVLIFTVALVAVSARIFLPSDMAAPAPIGIIIPNS